MDIQRWLEATTDRAPPDKSEDPNIPEFINPPPAERNANSRRYHRRKKKGASSDSSVSAPRQDKLLKAARKRHVRSDDSKGESDINEPLVRRSQSIEVISSDVPSRSYERRPRHRTKLDRYEPKTKGPRRGSNARAEKKINRKRRRSHRNDGERTTGLVQSFQLKNGRKHNRLTLKHDAGAGLFKHGRASAQMTGRGNACTYPASHLVIRSSLTTFAVPDLVFNEMKFLQRPAEHQDEADQEAPPEQNSKNEKQRLNNNEISAYFNAKDVTNHEQAQAESLQKEPEKAKAHRRDLQQHQSPTHCAPPSTELRDKPFLGFGSKGAHTQSVRDHRDESTEYYLWSESVPRQSKTIEEPLEPPQRRPTDKRKSPERGQNGDHSSVRKDPYVAREANNNATEQDGGKWLPSKRARGPHIVEVYQPRSARKRRKLEGDTSLKRTTRHLLPRFPPTNVREAGSEQHQQEKRNFERLRSDYRTSDILDFPDSQNIRATKQNSGQAYHLSAAKTVSSDKENAHPQSSIDKLLSQARKATEYVSRPLEQPAKPNLKRARKDSVPEDYLDFGEDRSRSHRVPFNQLNDQERVAIPNRESATTMQTPNARHFSAARLDSRLDFADLHHDKFDFAEQMEDDEMLDNEPDVHRPLYPDSHTYDADAHAEDLAMRAASIPRSGLFESQSDRLDSEQHECSIMRASISRHTVPSHVLSIGGEILSERLIPPQSEIDDVFAGFWKPNKLY